MWVGFAQISRSILLNRCAPESSRKGTLMLGHEELKTLFKAGATVFGSDGEKIGTLGLINLDDRTGIPDFVTVHTGFLGATEHFVPLNEAEVSNGNLYVKFPKEFVKDAPEVDPAVVLSAEDEERLYRYYSQAGAGNLHTQGHPGSRQSADESDSVDDVGLPRLHPAPDQDTDVHPEDARGRPTGHLGP